MKLANDDYIDPKLRAKLRKKFSSMMSSLFKEEGASLRIEILSEPEVTSFIDTHSSVLNGAISKSKMSDKMRSRMEESNWIFSGMKTFHELNEALPSMIDENGNKKPFERFLKDVQSIDERYNKNYLRAEYGFAEASAQMASKWERFAEDGDEYNLQYRTAGDDAVRPEHAALEGVTLPQSDKFWDSYWPLNGWNCRCTVVQVLKNKYPVTPREEAMRRGKEALAKDKKGMFRFNSGKEQRTFPAYNPYTTSKCKTCDLAKMKLAANVSDNELCESCIYLQQCYIDRDEVIKEGKGTVMISRLIDREGNDYKKVLQVAKEFAKDGATVKMTPKMSRPAEFLYDCVYGSLKGTKYYGKCPDMSVNGVWYEHEGLTTGKGKRAFSNMMSRGLEQSDRLIIDNPGLTDAFMKKSIYNRIAKYGQSINEVWIRENNGIRCLFKRSKD